MSTAKALQLDNVLPFSLHVDVEGDTIWLRMRASRKELFETAIVSIFLLGVIPFIWLPDLAPLPSSLKHSLALWWNQFLLKIHMPAEMVADANKFLKGMFTLGLVGISLSGLVNVVALWGGPRPLASIDWDKGIISIYKRGLFRMSKLFRAHLNEIWCLFIVWEHETDFSDTFYFYWVRANGEKCLIDETINPFYWMGPEFAFLSFLLDKPIFVTHLRLGLPWDKRYLKGFEDIPDLITEDFLKNYCDVLVFRDAESIGKWLRTGCKGYLKPYNEVMQ